MFYGCSSLISLNLSNFDTSKVINMVYIFGGCSKLEYINLKNFQENNSLDASYIFDSVPENIVACLNELSDKILTELKNKICYTIDCSFNWEINQKMMSDKNECIRTNVIKNVIDNISKNKPKVKTKEEEIKYYNTILEKIDKVFTAENYNTSELDNGKDETFKTEKMTITFTTSDNQRNNINKNTTTIDLGQCELSLRKFYNISNDEAIYIKKLDVVQEGMKTPKIEYEVYAKLFGNKLIKLNLTVCKNDKITLSIPIIDAVNLDKLNNNSAYYNDICYNTQSPNGTDISLKDRKNEYVNNTVCQEDCQFTHYDYTTKKAKCSCDIKEFPKSFEAMKIDKNKLLSNFKNIKNIANIRILTCFKNLFSKLGLSKNIGFYIIMSIVIFHIIVLFVFFIRGPDTIKKQIKDIIYAIKNIQSKYGDKEGKNKETNNKKTEGNINKTINNINNINNNNKIIRGNKKKSENKKGKKRKKKGRNKLNKKRKEKENQINIENFIINIENNNNKKKRNTLRENTSKTKTKDKNVKEKVKKILAYNDDEINDLPYDIAMQSDGRSYCKYYFSLIKTKHNLIFTFCYNKDYNSKIIKIDLFFIIFTANYAVNALFFNDDTMHNIYIKQGEFDFAYEFPKIVYSTLITMVLEFILNLLALCSDAVSDFKANKESNNINERTYKLNKKLKIKFVFYYIISFILLLFFWYYLSMFGAVYRNTQMHLLKDTGISFLLSFILPFFTNLFPGFFRIPALASRKDKRECLYNFSKILQKYL